MKQEPETGVLAPFDFRQINEEVPELKKFGFTLDSISFSPIDSSEVQPDLWVALARTIEDHYDRYEGFVILHGTDTMAYSASALSFMLENLSKPVIFTGSQLPIGMLRTDGKENLISSIEIAAAQENGLPRVPEVCIFFENKLLRANRTTKFSAEHFNAFHSFNYPALAEAGINIRFNTSAIRYPSSEVPKPLRIYTQMDTNVASLKIFPGIQESTVRHILSTPHLRSVILETFGSGNAPTAPWFIDALRDAIDRGLLIVNRSQCLSGSVEMEKYQTGKLLKKVGVLSGYDLTFEAALTKMYFLQGKYFDNKALFFNLLKSIRGELTI